MASSHSETLHDQNKPSIIIKNDNEETRINQNNIIQSEFKIPNNTNEENSMSNEPTIATRTRSHLSIPDFVANDNLDFPDVDPNLYDNPDSKSNPEYREFLNQLYSKETVTTDANTDDNDPEYVYNDDIFSYGWRLDLNELRELQQDDQSETGYSESRSSSQFHPKASTSSFYESHQQHQQHHHDHHQQELHHQPTLVNHDVRLDHKSSLPRPQDELFRSSSKASKRNAIRYDMNHEYSRVLNQQLRQHIQLLTQTYLLTVNTTNMRNEAEEAKNHLLSYQKMFKNKSKPSNLSAALELVNEYAKPEDLKTLIRINWRPLPVPEVVKRIINKNPNVFMYNRLKPMVAFSIAPKKLISKLPKINFTINEDRLLAYALNEFKHESPPYAYIASLLMTAKTKTQISNHIKNTKRSPGCDNNPLKLYYQTGELPFIDLSDDLNLTPLVSADKNWSDQGEEEQEGSYQKEKQYHQEEQVLEEIEQLVDIKVVSRSATDEKMKQQSDTADSFLDHLGSHNQNEMINNERVISDSTGIKQIVDTEPKLNNNLNNNNHEYDHGGAVVLHQETEDLMNMDLDDLMAASTTISKSAFNNNTNNNNLENKNIRYMKLKRSMISLMSHNFVLPESMGDLIIYEFLQASQMKLTERNNFHLLQLLTDLMRLETKGRDSNTNNNMSDNNNIRISEKNCNDSNNIDNNNEIDDDKTIVKIYQEIKKFLNKINAPEEIHDRIVLFLTFEQALKCGCSEDYLYWMKFFEFIQHLELYHDNVEILEKKLLRLIDALQKDDIHKRKLAISNLINKHPILKRDFDFLSLSEKPHSSLFNCDEDFDDVTDVLSSYDIGSLKLDIDQRPSSTNPSIEEEEEPNQQQSTATTTTSNTSGGNNINRHNLFDYEHFNSKLSKEELAYATPNCCCRCHSDQNYSLIGGQHCADCNLKFMRGRMYLVNKIKPILAEWSYLETAQQNSSDIIAHNNSRSSSDGNNKNHHINNKHQLDSGPNSAAPTIQGNTTRQMLTTNIHTTDSHWTFEEDKELLEFCRAKADENGESFSFDVSTFEELIARGKAHHHHQEAKGSSEPVNSGSKPATQTTVFKKSAREIAHRFNQLMDLYKAEA